MVLALGGEALESERLDNIVHDIALLNSLGVKLIIVFGARPQIDARLNESGFESTFHRGLRVTHQSEMGAVLESYGRLRAELEARLSMGVINSPMHGAGIKVVSGNYVMAKPVGVLDGIDFACTGTFRRLDVPAVQAHLEQRSLVLIPALGYSMTGEIFNLGYEALAAQVSIAIGAEKLVLFGLENGLSDAEGKTIKQLSVEQAKATLSQDRFPISETQNSHLDVAIQGCEGGVKRVHLISFMEDEAFLRELFTRDGFGTMVSQDAYDEIRQADLDDVNGIMELIRPLEQKGILVRRSRERLESEVNQFLVNVRDGAVLACAALYLFEGSDAGELSCFAVDDQYRKEGRGDRLLDAIATKAKALGLSRLFVLTTQTEHWFRERGFVPVPASTLPETKGYNPDRNAKVLSKPL